LDFEAELSQVLPADLPHRDAVVSKGARHLALIAEANQIMNLTRITSPREAAIKHVLDSVWPWRMFLGARTVLDAGTGPGFPGIPLALVLPEVRFTLAESTQKKARFVEAVVGELELSNVAVSSARVEDLVKSTPYDAVIARAFAPLGRALQWLAPALKKGSRAVLYKGPDSDQEIRDAGKLKFAVRVIDRYELPDGMGSRTIVQVG
jgi:16S rRNA (guanine527-N7)-methyltransferase